MNQSHRPPLTSSSALPFSLPTSPCVDGHPLPCSSSIQRANASIIDPDFTIQDIDPHTGRYSIAPRTNPFDHLTSQAQSLQTSHLLASHHDWINSFLHQHSDVPSRNNGTITQDSDSESEGQLPDADITQPATNNSSVADHLQKIDSSTLTADEIHQYRAAADQAIKLFLNDISHLIFIVECMQSPAPPPLPGAPPGVPSEAFLRKRIHPVPLVQPELPLRLRVDNLVHTTMSQRQVLSHASNLLAKGAADLSQSIHAESIFFRQQALALRNRYWRLSFPLPPESSTPHQAQGYLAIDYNVHGYDPPRELAEQGHHVPTAGAALFRVFPGQVLPNGLDIFPEYPATPEDPTLVHVSPYLRLHLAGAGFSGRRRRFYIRRKDEGDDVTYISSQNRSQLFPRSQSFNDSNNSHPRHFVDAHLRRAQANFITEVQMHRLISQAKHDHGKLGAIVNDREIVVSMGQHSNLHIGIEDEPGSDDEGDSTAASNLNLRKRLHNGNDDGNHIDNSVVMTDIDSTSLGTLTPNSQEHHLPETITNGINSLPKTFSLLKPDMSHDEKHARAHELYHRLLLSLDAPLSTFVQGYDFSKFVSTVKQLVSKHMALARSILPYKSRVCIELGKANLDLQPVNCLIHKEIHVYLVAIPEGVSMKAISDPWTVSPIFSLALMPPRQLTVKSIDASGWTTLEPTSVQIGRLVRHHVARVLDAQINSLAHLILSPNLTTTTGSPLVDMVRVDVNWNEDGNPLGNPNVCLELLPSAMLLKSQNVTHTSTIDVPGPTSVNVTEFNSGWAARALVELGLPMCSV